MKNVREIIYEGVQAGVDDSYSFAEWVVNCTDYWDGPLKSDTDIEHAYGEVQGWWQHHRPESLVGAFKTLQGCSEELHRLIEEGNHDSYLESLVPYANVIAEWNKEDVTTVLERELKL